MSYADNYPKVLGIDRDKWLHFGASGLVTTATYGLLTSFTGREVEARKVCLIGAIGMGLAVGLAKEVNDKMESNAQYLDMGDLAANALGVAFSATLIYYFDIHGKSDVNVGFTGNKAILTYRW